MAETSAPALAPAEGRARDTVWKHGWVRLFAALLMGAAAASIGLLGAGFLDIDLAAWWLAAPALAGAFVGFIGAPALFLTPARWYLRTLQHIAGATTVGTLGGMLAGFIAAAPLTPPLAYLPQPWGTYLPIIASLLFGVIGATIGYAWTRASTSNILNSLDTRLGRGRSLRTAHPTTQILLDTSAVIDGRIADIGRTGFIRGPLLIPRFVLDELRHIADSSDALRRNRGRRGLEILNKLRKEAVVPVEVINLDVKEVREVDGKLVKLAERLQCPIVTTDFNLNRVAELQGVTVLNINELANSLRPVVLPGEDMTVQVIQEGKEHNQGVAFLDDGTMVVIEGGRRYIGSEIEVLVSRVLQTAAGRIIFCHPKES